LNQRGFDNQLLTAAEAARILGVKRQTLYAYASRGLLGSGPRGPGRKASYPAAAVYRLKTRAQARSGHTAVAAAALRFGEPVLDTRVTDIRPDGPYYRGHNAVALARRGLTFEQVAELLWTSDLPAKPPCWRGPRMAPLSTLLELSARAAQLNQGPRLSESLDEARALIVALAGGERGSIAERLGAHRSQRAAIDTALVLSADNELNPSTFVARIAASTGASLAACLAAALATLSGPRHGGMCDRVDALLAEAERIGPRAAVRQRVQRGEDLPGFEAGAYPHGDPRVPPLLETARRKSSKRHAVMQQIHDEVAALGGEAPSLDFGLVAVAHAVELAPGTAARFFALGRTAGWVAHVMEQREGGAPIRPRARYLGSAGSI
jgi:citrate synthase